HSAEIHHVTPHRRKAHPFVATPPFTALDRQGGRDAIEPRHGRTSSHSLSGMSALARAGRCSALTTGQGLTTGLVSARALPYSSVHRETPTVGAVQQRDIQWPSARWPLMRSNS